MVISEQTINFLIIMLFHIFVTSPSFLNITFLYKLLTVIVIAFCIQYLTMINLPLIAWFFVFIPIVYILSVGILNYLINR